MNHLERNPALDHRVIEAEFRVFDFGSGLFATVELSALLRVNHADPGKRFLVPQVLLVRVVPLVHGLDNRQPALVNWLCVELCEPWPKILSDAVRDPEADLI